MQRRGLLKLGVAGLTVLGLGGVGVALWRPGIESGGRLSATGREVFRAVAWAVLDGCLPEAPPDLDRALTAHLRGLDTVIASLPEFARQELSRLLALLATAPGRRMLAQLDTPWHAAARAQLQRSLESMRQARGDLRQQAYHALRDLTNAAYFADPASWPLLGYPGPRAIDA